MNNVSTNPSESNNDIADLCMNQVCGPANKLDNPEELAVQLIEDVDFQKKVSSLNKEFKQEMNKFLDEATKEKMLTLEAYHDLQKRNDLSPEASYLKLHDLTSLINEIPRSSYEAGPNPEHPFILNKKETLSKLQNLSETQRQWILDGLDHFFQSPIGSDTMLQYTMDPINFMKLKNPSLRFNEALKKEGLILQKIASNLLNGPRKSILQMIPNATNTLTDPTINKAINGEDMTDAEISEFMKTQSSILIFNDILTPKEQGGQTVLLSQSNPESLADFIKNKKFDQQIHQYEKDLKDPEKVKKSREIAYESCFSNYIFQLATLPNRSQIEAAEKNSTWAINKTKEALGAVLSVSTKKMLDQLLDQSFFPMPRDQESFHKFFMDKLKNEINSSEKTASEYQDLIKRGQHKSVTLLNIHLNSSEYTIDQHFQDVRKFCDRFEIKLTYDNALSSTGGIQTSWVSVRKPEFGKSVMLHELGHIAFAGLDSEKASIESRGHFQSIRKCLAENHPEDPSKGFYVKEDWADLVAAKGAGPENLNVGCELNTQKENQYSDLTLINPRKDEHSQHFFRALHFYKIQNGKLPSACDQLIQSQGSQWQFKTCF